MTPRQLSTQLDEYVASTPADRDRFVDLLRVASIAVVVVWHWALSITQWEDGALVMPNPIDVVPGARFATWLLQVMPVFFIVGGFVNHAGWVSVRRKGGGWREFTGSRVRRLALPTLVFATVWAVFEAAVFVVRDDHRPVLEWGAIAFIPLWFLAAYLWVIVLVPVTARLHEASGGFTVTAMGVVIGLVDVARFRLGAEVAGLELFGLVNSALVWVFVHQLGYFYRDGTYARIGVRGQLAILLGALAGMIVLTRLPVYPVSMVATRDVPFSHMWPTTAMIGVVALLQLGVAMLVRPMLRVWLDRRRVWKTVIAANAVLLTVFVWHMTAKLIVIGAYEALGFDLLTEPTLLWWLQRPLWLLAPGAVLAVLVAVFGPVELQMRGD